MTNQSNMHILENGTVEFREQQSGGYFRADDLPSLIHDDGTREWCGGLPGQIHRENKPATIWDDGILEWWQNGLRHRVDGPAVIYPDGSVEYWVRNQKVCPFQGMYEL